MGPFVHRFVFFFQAEDGIRDLIVTGVQTCALPIYAMQALSTLGVFRDPENAGAFVGFLAGVIAANPERANDLIGKLLALPANDQWVIVQAIAYSGRPDWKNLLARFAPRMPTRRLMIQKYLDGRLPTLDQAGFEKSPGTLDKLRGAFTFGEQPAKK